MPLNASLTLADPFPGGLGIRVSGSLSRWARLQTGFSFSGSSSASLTNYGLGIQFLHPDWPVTPYVGVTSAVIFHGGTGTISSFSANGWHAYPSFGLDWQTREGFSLQAGFHWSFRNNLPSSLTAAIGWSFDL